MTSHYTRSKACQDAGVLKEGDVEPVDVSSVSATHSGVDHTVRCKIKAATGPESVSIELAGPESVPPGGGPVVLGLPVLSPQRPSWEALAVMQTPLLSGLPRSRLKFSPAVASPAPAPSASAFQPPPPLPRPPSLSGTPWKA